MKDIIIGTCENCHDNITHCKCIRDAQFNDSLEKAKQNIKTKIIPMLGNDFPIELLDERVIKMTLNKIEFDGYFYKAYGGINYSVKDIDEVPTYIKRRNMGSWKDLDCFIFQKSNKDHKNKPNII